MLSSAACSDVVANRLGLFGFVSDPLLEQPRAVTALCRGLTFVDGVVMFAQFPVDRADWFVVPSEPCVFFLR